MINFLPPIQWRNILFFAFFMSTASIAQAQNTTPPATGEVVSQAINITVESDGRYVKETEVVIRLLDASGRDSVAQHTFSFNDQHSTLDILEAETIKSDGKHIKVLPDQIRLQEDPAAAGVAMFTTSKRKTIIFPDVNVGDSIRYRVRHSYTEPEFPGQFTDSYYLTPDQRLLSFRVTLKAPKSLNLQSESTGFHETREVGTNGKNIWNWTFTQPDVRPVDRGKVDVFLKSPHMIITSFPSWEDVVQAYRERADDKVKIAPEIRALAEQLTSGISDRREQAKRLYDWVRGNIRYVGLYLGNGGYVPHEAPDILRNHYGDCKDHVVLLEALLRAKGIESHGALINLDANFNIWPLPVPGYFDHIITYVPEFDLYLDTTQQYLSFGERSYSISAKPVLHVDASTGMRKTPPLSSDMNTRTTTMTAIIDQNGSLRGQISNISSGSIAYYQRTNIARIDPLHRSDVIQDSLAKKDLRGKGTLTADDPKIGGDHYRFAMDFVTDDKTINLSGPESIKIELPVPSSVSIANGITIAEGRLEPLFDTQCSAEDLTDTYEITFPKEIKIVAIPRSVSIKEGFVRYDAKYEREGQTVRASRHYVMSNDRGYCTPTELADMRRTFFSIHQDLNAKILFTPLDSQ